LSNFLNKEGGYQILVIGEVPRR